MSQIHSNDKNVIDLSVEVGNYQFNGISEASESEGSGGSPEEKKGSKSALLRLDFKASTHRGALIGLVLVGGLIGAGLATLGWVL